MTENDERTTEHEALEVVVTGAPGAAQLAVAELESTAVVERKTRLADRVMELVLRRADGADWMPWTPGSHIDLLGPDGKARQYSLCGSRRDRAHLRVAVLREASGSGSAWVHDVLEEGMEVAVRGPRNHFELRDNDHYVFIAGGIGITPFTAMIDDIERRGKSWTLHYGGQTRSGMAFAEQLQAFGDRVHLYPKDETGRIPLAELLADPAEYTGVYVCGPVPMLDTVHALSTGWPKRAVNMERFVPRAVEDTGPDSPIEVELATTGRTIEVGAEESILEAMERSGVPALYSCRVGTCGTCELGVLDGVPDHRDSVLDDEDREENVSMMICVSRARTARLVLDI